MKSEKVGLADRVVAVCRRKDGSVKWVYDSAKEKGHSMTQVGMAEVASLILADVEGTAFDYIAIGTGVGVESATDTALGTEIKRKAAVGTRTTTTFSNDTCQWVVTFAAADTLSGTDEIIEYAVFNAASNGTMLFRKKGAAAKSCDWDAGDTLEVTCQCVMVQGA